MAIKTIIDTNVIVASLSSKSKHHWLIEFLIYQRIELFVNEDILLEYEEVLKWKYSESVAANFLAALKELPNAAAADYLITHDKHFSVLAAVPFPKVNVVRIDEFQVALNIHQ